MDLSLEGQAPASASHLASPSLHVLTCEKTDSCQPHSLRVTAGSKQVTGVFAGVVSVQMRPAWETLENSLVRPQAQPAKLLSLGKEHRAGILDPQFSQ